MQDAQAEVVDAEEDGVDGSVGHEGEGHAPEETPHL